MIVGQVLGIYHSAIAIIRRRFDAISNTGDDCNSKLSGYVSHRRLVPISRTEYL